MVPPPIWSLGRGLGARSCCKTLPETKGFVRTGAGYAISVVTRGKMKDPALVATERGSAGEGRVAPDEELVVGVAVGGEELSVLGRPHQTTDLVWVVFVEGRGRGGRGGVHRSN